MKFREKVNRYVLSSTFTTLWLACLVVVAVIETLVVPVELHY